MKNVKIRVEHVGGREKEEMTDTVKEGLVYKGEARRERGRR